MAEFKGREGMSIVKKKSAEDRVLFKLSELREIVAVISGATPSTYRALALAEARSLVKEFKDEVTAELLQGNAAQAKDILELKQELIDAVHSDGLMIAELKAHVNNLRDALLDDACVISILRTGFSNDHMDYIHEGYLESPAQPLAAHNAAIEAEVIERCAAIGEAAVRLPNPLSDAIRSLPRKYKEE